MRGGEGGAVRLPARGAQHSGSARGRLRRFLPRGRAARAVERNRHSAGEYRLDAGDVGLVQTLVQLDRAKVVRQLGRLGRA